MNRQITIFISTGAYSGFSPVAPGTAGSIVGILLYLLVADLPPLAYLAITLITLWIGVKTAGISETLFKKKDPKEVVIDEIAGILVTMFMIPADGAYILCGFILFRILDIAKPFIKWSEKIGGGWGIMLDDILAGVMANLILHGTKVLL